MRSHTASDLPGRCRRCWIRDAFCICADVPRVETQTRVLFVRHERESFKSTGTVRIANLALPNSEIVDFGEEAAPANERLSALVAGAVLVFPAEPPQPWPTAPVEKVILLDGTWRQTRRMFHRLPALHSLPRLTLPPKDAQVLRLRESTFADGRSTMEAAADALERLESPEKAEQLHRLHALYVERVFRARGVWEMKRSQLAGA